MASDTESLMSRIEREFPHLINCFGNVDTTDRICNNCPHIYPCWKLQPDLKLPEFWEGKFRWGFGKPKFNTKYMRFT